MVWYYTDGQQQFPVEDADLPALVRGGKLTSKTFVWKEGMAEWEPAGLQADLKPFLAAKAPPLPPGIPAAAGPAVAATGSKKMLYIGIGVAVVVLGGGAFFFLNSKDSSSEVAEVATSSEPSDLSSIETTDAAPAASVEAHSSEDGGSSPSSRPGDEVQEGQEYTVTIDGKSRKNEQDGVAHIGGLVVFVQNENEIGKTVKIRITKRGARHAVGEVIGAGGGGSTRASSSGDEPRRKSSGGRKSGGGDASEGSEHECVVTGIGKKGDPMCKIDGKVTFIHDAKLNEGDRVKVRITKSAKKVNHAELVN